MPISILCPLHIPIARELLICVLQDVLGVLHERRRLTLDVHEREELDLMVNTRERFLEELRTGIGANVNVALYPVDSEPVREPPRLIRFAHGTLMS